MPNFRTGSSGDQRGYDADYAALTSVINALRADVKAATAQAQKGSAIAPASAPRPSSGGGGASAPSGTGLTLGFVGIAKSTGDALIRAYAGEDYEAWLGNPATDGYILTSTILGVRSWIAPPAGTGDMTRAVYDTGNNGIVDAAESAPWSGITGKPSAFPPSAHVHSGADITTDTISTARLPNATTTTSGTAIFAADGNATANRAVLATDTRLSNARVPLGAAGGDLGGTYPNPTVSSIQGHPVSATAPATGQVLKWDGAAYTPVADATGGGGGGGTATPEVLLVPLLSNGTPNTSAPGGYLEFVVPPDSANATAIWTLEISCRFRVAPTGFPVTRLDYDVGGTVANAAFVSSAAADSFVLPSGRYSNRGVFANPVTSGSIVRVWFSANTGGDGATVFARLIKTGVASAATPPP